MAIQSINPATGEMLKTYEPFPEQEVQKSLSLGRDAFSRWSRTSYAERASFLMKAAQELKENKEVYAKLITLEMGKPITQSYAEIEKCALVCEYYAKNGERFLADDPVETEYKKSYAHFQPLGVVLLVMPWNFPFWQVFRAAAPALMAGNTIVLKHASNVPQNSLAIEDIFTKAGFPEHVFKTLLVEGSNMERVIADQRISAVSLTGGTIAGQRIAATAGKYLKKTVMELGGSDPFIVLADADLEASSSEAVQSRTLNTGQSCISAKRFILEKTIADVFLEKFVAKMKALKVGDPMDTSTQMGPVAREDLLLEVHGQVERSVQMGATALLGGRRIDRTGSFYEPSILTDLKAGMPAYDEEIFGPVASVIIAENEADAIRIANSSMYGLGGSVWTTDLEKGERVAQEVESGAVFVNKMVRSDPRLPFGGVKQSGFGRELGSYGIKEFVNIKTIVVA